MIGIGLFLIVIGYSIIYWGINAVQGNSQDNFISYIFPFVDKSGNIKQSNFLTPKGNVPGALGPVTQADVNKMKNKPTPVDPRKKQNP
jgi:hypothetical protein